MVPPLEGPVGVVIGHGPVISPSRIPVRPRPIASYNVAVLQAPQLSPLQHHLINPRVWPKGNPRGLA
jgi:hypothetical protein